MAESVSARKNTSREGYQHIFLMKKKILVAEALARASAPMLKAYNAKFVNDSKSASMHVSMALQLQIMYNSGFLTPLG